MNSNRRKFFSLLGIAPILAPGVAKAYAEPQLEPAPLPDLPKPKPPPPLSGYSFYQPPICWNMVVDQETSSWHLESRGKERFRVDQAGNVWAGKKLIARGEG